MTRFYLHLHNQTGTAPDEQGQDLGSLDEARQLALDSIRDVLSEEVRQGRIDFRGHIEIADETGEALAILRFSEAVELVVDGEAA
ncbi:DUF6894 family protein [Sphingobium sp.]|uniref:DUF6894 family protein n=1 Tax=Sphingobium sp. TaxID=1912891 RepID=UPI002C3171F0|nr:hypothetical protein [Sphingobium sp.]HUD95326.1 hypothetical protein [Sphingobium sp.]